MLHRLIEKAKKPVICISFGILLNFLALLFLYSTVYAEGIAISGAFNSYHYKIVPGEAIQTPDIDIVVHNNYNIPIKMKLAVEAPKGVSIDLDGKQITIPANGSKSFPVSVAVDKTVVPGEYEIGVSADPLPDEKTGIAVLGGAQLRTKLTVFGEAGRIKINVVNPEGDPFLEAEIKLFEKASDGNLTLVGYGRGSTLEERVAPGEYEAKVYYQGNEVGSSTFNVKKDETKKVTINAKTVFIQGFTITPQYGPDGKEVASVIATYTLKNIYKPIQGARVMLKVYHNASEKTGFFAKLGLFASILYAGEDTLLEEVEMATYPTLEIGSQSGRFVYVPIDKWKKGAYKFGITLYGKKGKNLTGNNEAVYGETELSEFKIEGNDGYTFIYISIVAILLILIIVFIVWKKYWLPKRKK